MYCMNLLYSAISMYLLMLLDSYLHVDLHLVLDTLLHFVEMLNKSTCITKVMLQSPLTYRKHGDIWLKDIICIDLSLGQIKFFWEIVDLFKIKKGSPNTFDLALKLTKPTKIATVAVQKPFLISIRKTFKEMLFAMLFF